MAVVSIREKHEGRKTKAGSDFERQHTRIFEVFTNNPYDDGMTVLNSLALGQFVDRNGVIMFCRRGAAHPIDGGAFCTDLDAAASADDRRKWTVTAEYSTHLERYQVTPDKEPTTFTHSSEMIEQAIAIDLDGKVIENSAYDTFEQPATIDTEVTVIRAVCTRLNYVPTVDRTPFIRRVNSVGFQLDTEYWAPGQLILDELTVDMQNDAGVQYRKFNYTFKGRRDLYVETSTTTTAAVLAGANVFVPLNSVTGISVGSQIVIDGETVTVNAVDVIGKRVLVDLLAGHGNGSTVKNRSYHPWDYQPLDMGFRYISDVGPPIKWLPFTDKAGQMSQVPKLLDGSGGALATWTIPPQDPVRLLFRTKERADFNLITFP